MKVINLSALGFCSGVKEATNKLNEFLKKNPLAYCVHPLVHNHAVQKEYQAHLLPYQDDLQYPTIISAHGLPINHPAWNTSHLDLTCHKIYQVRDLIVQKIKEGYQVIYYGDPNHQECRYIASLSPAIQITKDYQQINSKIFLTCQTTADDLAFSQFALQYPQAMLYNNTCSEVNSRLKAIRSIKDGIVLVIGDHSSANTNLLYQASLNAKNPTLLIETPHDLQISLDVLKKYQIAYLVSATSAPSEQIEQVRNYLKTI
ncbi:MAG: hypothetical protein LBV55_00550 [Acholeplasmatales bacterium]|jgi:4-hydroxy-3-methylbut-2-enyl diphosphate reductase|nr:hypothetical protein [Acholeplasmatales bacterium]